MGAQGLTAIDFGAFPGSSDTFLDVSAPGVLLASSAVEAWIAPKGTGTATHTVDEHMVEELAVHGVCTVNDTIRIYGRWTGANGPSSRSNNGHRLYGTYQVGWVWN